MSVVNTSSIVPGQDSVQPFAAPSTSDDGGLTGADIAAIVLGVLLLVFIIVIVVVCVLIKTGKIFAQEDKSRVAPSGLLRGFSVTPARLKDCSFIARTKDRSLRRATSRDTEDPTIYMYDDVYHPPNSRPLPTNKVKTEPYFAVTRSSVRSVTRPSPRPSFRGDEATSRYHLSRSHRSRSQRSSHGKRENLFNEKTTQRVPTPRNYTHRGVTQTPPPTPEPDVDFDVVPDRINITTSGRSPYVNRTVRY